MINVGAAPHWLQNPDLYWNRNDGCSHSVDQRSKYYSLEDRNAMNTDVQIISMSAESLRN